MKKLSIVLIMLLAMVPAFSQLRLRVVAENKDTLVVTEVYQTKTITYQTSHTDTVTLKYNGSTVPPTTPPTTPPSGYKLTFSAGYETASEVNTNQGMYNSISKLQKTEGVSSFRSEVRGSQGSQSAGYRGEMQYDISIAKPVEGIYEWDVYYENWKAVAGGGHSIQWHPPSSSGSAVLSLQNYGGMFNVVRSIGGANYHQKASTQIATQPNRWYKMRVEVKWSTRADGYIRWYIDGVLYYAMSGIQTADGGIPYWKVGQNRWSMGSQDNTIVYYDAVRVYVKQ